MAIRIRKFIVAAILLFSHFYSFADYNFNIGAEVNLGVGSNDFAPFYLHANRFGKITQSKNAQIDIWAEDTLSLDKRFDFSWGVEVAGGYASKVDYPQWDNAIGGFKENMQGPAPIWIQQLYGEVKWRCLYLSLGLKDRKSCFVDQNLSSGDLLWSGNSRGIPEARIGFVDYQTVPWTKKWLEADICLSYGKFIDTDWVNHHFDYYTGKRNPGPFWTYKRLSLRSNHSKPFMFQFGFQMSGIFGGYTYKYYRGEHNQTLDNYGGFKDFFLMLIPLNSNTYEGYKTGDHKGTWDIAARYRFKGGETLRAYTQWLWEDGSSLLRQNGWDGLWGVEFSLGKRWWISKAVAEYIDLTNMCGPISFAPGYHNTGDGYLPYESLGRDSYYTNFYYRDYVNYGLNMGSPMVQGLLFYTDPESIAPNNGNIHYFRVRGFHIGISGALGSNFDYILKYNHRKAWGNSNTYALINPIEADSFMAGVSYAFPNIKGLNLGVSIGVDHGTMPSNAVGGMVTLNYTMPIKIGK